MKRYQIQNAKGRRSVRISGREFHGHVHASRVAMPEEHARVREKGRQNGLEHEGQLGPRDDIGGSIRVALALLALAALALVASTIWRVW